MDGTSDSEGTPESYQPLGKDYPLDQDDITGEKLVHSVESAQAEESGGGDPAGEDPNLRRRGHYEVPTEEQSGEGWTLPTRAGGGWEHPVEPSLEERLEEVDEEDQ